MTPFDPLSAPSNVNVGMYSASSQGNIVDWDIQDLVWSNLPWDWNLMEEMRLEAGVDGGVNEGGWGWGNVTENDQMNGDSQPQQSETMGMPVL